MSADKRAYKRNPPVNKVRVKTYNLDKFPVRGRNSETTELFHKLVGIGQGFELEGHERIKSLRVAACKYNKVYNTRIVIRKLETKTLVLRVE